LAALGVLALATAIRLVTWGAGSVEQRLRESAEAQTLSLAMFPSPVRTPAGAIRVQLDALQHKDRPAANAGLATIYNFMEPAVRSNLGAFADFESALDGSAYADLFSGAEVGYGPLQVNGNEAHQVIEVATPNNQRAMYVFSLALQPDGPYAGCWMTHDIVRYPRRQPQAE
jgi:hypothetical protein